MAQFTSQNTPKVKAQPAVRCPFPHSNTNLRQLLFSDLESFYKHVVKDHTESGTMSSVLEIAHQNCMHYFIFDRHVKRSHFAGYCQLCGVTDDREEHARADIRYHIAEHYSLPCNYCEVHSTVFRSFRSLAQHLFSLHQNRSLREVAEIIPFAEYVAKRYGEAARQQYIRYQSNLLDACQTNIRRWKENGRQEARCYEDAYLFCAITSSRPIVARFESLVGHLKQAFECAGHTRKMLQLVRSLTPEQTNRCITELGQSISSMATDSHASQSLVELLVLIPAGSDLLAESINRLRNDRQVALRQQIGAYFYYKLLAHPRLEPRSYHQIVEAIFLANGQLDAAVTDTIWESVHFSTLTIREGEGSRRIVDYLLSQPRETMIEQYVKNGHYVNAFRQLVTFAGAESNSIVYGSFLAALTNGIEQFWLDSSGNYTAQALILHAAHLMPAFLSRLLEPRNVLANCFVSGPCHVIQTAIYSLEPRYSEPLVRALVHGNSRDLGRMLFSTTATNIIRRLACALSATNVPLVQQLYNRIRSLAGQNRTSSGDPKHVDATIRIVFSRLCPSA